MKKRWCRTPMLADYMLVLARTGDGGAPDQGLTLFIVDMKKPGIEVEVIPSITGETLCQVRFENVILGGGDVLGTAGAAENMLSQILDKAALLKCAEVSGACQAVLEMTVAYAKDRHQFGKPIGTFQVIQHKLVDMLMEVEGLQHLVYQAAWMMSAGADCADADRDGQSKGKRGVPACGPRRGQDTRRNRIFRGP